MLIVLKHLSSFVVIYESRGMGVEGGGGGFQNTLILTKTIDCQNITPKHTFCISTLLHFFIIIKKPVVISLRILIFSKRNHQNNRYEHYFSTILFFLSNMKENPLKYKKIVIK